jgi:hypothetical protein
VKRVLPILAVVTLTACQTPASFEGNENSPYYLVPAGSHLVLRRDITIPADQLAVYLQNGKIYDTRWHLDLYKTYCKFELRDTSAVARPVMADDFEITGVHQNIFWTRADYMQFADVDQGFSMVVYTNILDLRSAHQPMVAGLACEKWNLPIDSTYPSISEMRQALGDVFSLKILPSR